MGHLRNFEIGVFRRLRRDPPSGKIHRLAFWVFLLYLVLAAGRLLPGRAGMTFYALSIITLILLVGLCIPLLWRWIFGRLLWKVRNRLVVTYLLMGLAPFVFLAALALISLYLFSGQFAIFAATAEINSELAHIGSENRAYAIHIAHMVAADPTARSVELPMADESASHRRSHIQVAAFYNDRPVSLLPASATANAITQVPSWVNDGFRGVVVDGENLYLRAVDRETAHGRTVTTVTSLPLAAESVDQLARGLGTVTIVPGVDIEDDNASPAEKASSGKTASEKAPAEKKHVTINVSPGYEQSHIDVGGREVDTEEARRRAIQGGTLPPAQHFYDIPVTFYAPLDTVDWATGKPHSTFTHVTSRPSLLYQRLFISSLKIAAIVQDLIIGVAILFGVLELFAFIMAVRLNRTITRSIRDLYQATMAIDRGDLAHRIHVTRNDQLAALSGSFNRMTASLQRLLEEQREKERLQNELAIAQEVQANLFPGGNISLPMLELHGACFPARTVSGDYYDFLVLGPAALGLAIGDISGKGISAALLMATLHSAVRAYQFVGEELITAGTAALANPLTRAAGEEDLECAEIFEEPARILALLNRHLYRSTQPEKYATLFLGHYDGLRRRLIYCNGGQLPPLLLRADDTITRLDCGGTVVGLLKDVTYEQGIEQLHSGDILIAYSDGITEPENEFGEFGEERLLEVVRRHRHLPLDAISEQVMQSLRTWIGGQEQPDDITLVLARQR